MDLITQSREGDVVTLTLTAPTMTPEFFAACEATFTALAGDASLRAVVVRSSAKAFSYGLDLPKAMAAYGPVMTGGGLAPRRAELHTLIRQLQRSFTAIATCPVPVVAAVHGACIGGGVDLIAACDVRVASADAKFSVRETKIAIVADLGSLQRLPAIIGPAHTRELALTGKDIDAARAERIGLVTQVAADRDGAWAAAQAVAAEIAANPPLTVRGVKQVLEYSTGKSVDDGLAYVASWNAAFLASEDLVEAATAFAQKRPPKFTGR
ncbi:MAG: crotonase/enoyl-CoA hydratase family protein [Deltaproteobacteria bacterium]|nr:crotonase/enoyl-CoA hydratase family protein [Kofleriaceae bacterium]